MPIIDKNDRSLKDNLVLAVLPKHDVEDRSKSCGGGGRETLKGEASTRLLIYLKDHLTAIQIMPLIYFSINNVNIAFLMQVALSLGTG